MGLINVLSAGAPKGGVALTAEAFEGKTGHRFEITFATAPTIKAAVERGDADADVVVATAPAVAGFEAEGRTIAGVQTVIGSIKAGVVVRVGAEAPDISSAESLKRALLEAESIVRNAQSSDVQFAELGELAHVFQANVGDRHVAINPPRNGNLQDFELNQISQVGDPLIGQSISPEPQDTKLPHLLQVRDAIVADHGLAQ